MFGVHSKLILLSLASSLARIVDLSQPFKKDEAAASSSPGALAVVKAASADRFLRSALVLEHGKIVAEYYRDDVNASMPYQAWSVTKSFTSMIVGLLIEEGKLSLDTTLGEIFPNSEAWANVSANSTYFRKAVTIKGIITHTSGLRIPPAQSVAAMKDILPTLPTEMIVQSFKAALYTGGVSGGGESLPVALAALVNGTIGEFSLIGTWNIMAYVVKEKTGKTPREYLQDKVMPYLGIKSDEFGWQQTLDGVEFAFHGIELTAHQMAKFGQLYLQNGMSKEGMQLVPQDWIKASTTKYSNNTPGSVFFHETNFGYGYLWWVLSPNAFCAFGMLGQDVCVDKATSRVIVQQRDLDAENDDVYKSMNLGVNYVAGSIASMPNMSFQAPTSEAAHATPTMMAMLLTSMLVGLFLF